jgi:hypothetical protein
MDIAFQTFLQGRYVILENGCWIWIDKRYDDDYGRVVYDGVRYVAHRASYIAFVGPIPNGVILHHTCTTPKCIAPTHLQPTTRVEHQKFHTATHCIWGHEFTPENTYVNPRSKQRFCRECKRRNERQRYYRSIPDN